MTAWIYPVIVSWTWGGGWLADLGYSDFAGSGVVHLTGGVAGIVGAAFVGPRIGRFEKSSKQYNKKLLGRGDEVIEGIKEDLKEKIKSNQKMDETTLHELRKVIIRHNEDQLTAHNIPFVVLGTLILWMGWLLFNAGSSLEMSTLANRQASELAMMNTFIAPSAGGITSFCFKKFFTCQCKAKS